MTMNLICFVAILCSFNVISGQPVFRKGSLQFHSHSTNPSKQINIRHRVCLSSPPAYVIALATTTDPSLPHQFDTNVLHILQASFIIDLIRLDQNTGWNTTIKVDWSFASAIGITYNDLYIWMPEPSKQHHRSRSQAAETCKQIGDGSLVDIVDLQMYDAVRAYVNTVLTDSTFVQVWFGMDYNITSGAVTLSSGQPGVNATKHEIWSNGFPKSWSANTGILGSFFPEPSNLNTGLLNWNPLEGTVVDMCAMKLT